MLGKGWLVLESWNTEETHSLSSVVSLNLPFSLLENPGAIHYLPSIQTSSGLHRVLTPKREASRPLSVPLTHHTSTCSAVKWQI